MVSKYSLFTFLILFGSASVVLADGTVNIIRYDRQIKGLDFDKSSVVVREAPDGETEMELKGSYSHSKKYEFTVVDQANILTHLGPGKFLIRMKAKKAIFPVTFAYVDNYGRRAKEKVVFVAEKPAQAPPEQPVPYDPSHSLEFGLSPSYVSYRQTAKDDYYMVALTAKLSYGWQFWKPHMDVAINSFINVFPFWRTPDSLSVRFWGTNIRVGYALPFVRAPWRLKLMGGVFFSTALPEKGVIGYRFVLYPQFYPVVSYALPNNRSVYLYLKYVSMTPSFSISFDRRELAFGFGMVFPLNKRWSLVPSFDFSSSVFEPAAGTLSQTTVFNLGIGVGTRF